MKEFQKVQMIAKNLPTGSYAAGCPAQDRGSNSAINATNSCVNCERTVWVVGKEGVPINKEYPLNCLLNKTIPMSKSISSINKEKSNLENGRCQVLDNNGIVIAEFDGKIEEINCQFFVIHDDHFFWYCFRQW